MPNIEVYGFAARWKLSHLPFICQSLERLSFAKEIVITTIESRVATLSGKESPFLRVISHDKHDKKQIAETVKTLKPLGYDIETVLGGKFFPGYK